MKKCIKAQLLVLFNRRQFKFVFAFSLIFSILSFLFYAFFSFGQYESDVKSYRDVCLVSGENIFSAIFIMVLPIISTAAFCDIFIEDKKSNRLSIIFQKCKKNEYYISSSIVSMLSNIFTIFVPMLINLILCAVAFPKFSSADLTGLAGNQANLYSASSDYMNLLAFKKLFMSSPFVYSFLYIVLMTLYACAGSLITYSLSYFIKNRGMIIVPFFVINCLTNICSSAIFKIFKINISISNYITSENISYGINYKTFFIILIIMIIVSIFISLKNLKTLGDIL